MMKKAPSIRIFASCKAIGIDISKAELVMVGLLEREEITRTINNTRKSINFFVRELAKAGYQNKILCESTGHYHLKLAVGCEENGLKLILINPLQASKHSQSKIRKVKSDPADAHTLATMCLTERKLPKVARISKSKALIQLKMGQLASLEKFLQKITQSRSQYEETYQELGLEPDVSQRALQASCLELKKVKKQLVRELDELLKDDLSMPEEHQILKTIPGFSETVAGLVGHLDRDVKNANSWVAYMGYDVSVRSSGTWRGRGKITKRGNAYLRKRMFQAAWGACLNYDYIKQHYEELKAAGRKHVEAVIIIARKLLKIAFQLLKTKTPYDKNKAVFG